MSISTFLQILRARWLVVLVLFVLSVGITFTTTLMLPQKYSATTEVVINSQGHDPITGSSVSASLLSRYVATQVDIIQSPELAARVVDRLNLDSRLAIRKRYRQTLDKHNGNLDEDYFRAWLIQSVQNHITVSPAKESSMLKISAAGEEPTYVAELANAYANAYVQTNLYLRTEPAKNYARWYDSQVEKLRRKLDAAQSELSTYQQKHGIAVIDEKLNVETKKLHELSLTLVDAQGKNVESHARLSQTERSGVPTADMLGNPVIRDLKSELAAAQARASKLSVVYRADYPEYRQARNEVDSLKHQLSQEIDAARNNVLSAAQISADRLKGDKAAVVAQKEQMLNLLSHKDKIALLKQDVVGARHAYESTLQEASKNKLESRRAQTDVMILSPAAIPLKPSWPNLPLNMLISAVLGMLLGVGSPLLLELFDRRVRGVRDLEEILNLPVLCYVFTKRGLISKQAVTR